jgi:hypothetical protein
MDNTPEKAGRCDLDRVRGSYSTGTSRLTALHLAPPPSSALHTCRSGAMPEFYNGAIDFKPGEEDDQRPKIDAACAPGCTSAWKNYLKCGDRIEAKVKPYCSLRPRPTRHAVRPYGSSLASPAPPRPQAPQAVARAASRAVRLPSP